MVGPSVLHGPDWVRGSRTLLCRGSKSRLRDLRLPLKPRSQPIFVVTADLFSVAADLYGAARQRRPYQILMALSRLGTPGHQPLLCAKGRDSAGPTWFWVILGGEGVIYFQGSDC